MKRSSSILASFFPSAGLDRTRRRSSTDRRDFREGPAAAWHYTRLRTLYTKMMSERHTTSVMYSIRISSITLTVSLAGLRSSPKPYIRFFTVMYSHMFNQHFFRLNEIQLAFFDKQPFHIGLSAPSPARRSMCRTRNILLCVIWRISSKSRRPLGSWRCCRRVWSHWSLKTWRSRYLWQRCLRMLLHVTVRVRPSITSYASLVSAGWICVGTWCLWVGVRISAICIGS